MVENSRKEHRARQSGDMVGSDFLFHLYRGAELLQDNHAKEAKQELENALRLQPAEPQGQDLLAQVYFRLGLYPRAIAIYESLAASFPEDVTPRVNLALCYLKTGQAKPARTQLEAVVSSEPSHRRAWGYLGLAFERLGEHEKARIAFERAGHRIMVRRMEALLDGTKNSPPIEAVDSSPDLSELRGVAEAAFHELDASDHVFSLAVPSDDRVSSDSGTWFAVEPGQSVGMETQSGPALPRAPRSGPAPAISTATPDIGIIAPQPPHEPRSSFPCTKSVDAFARETSLITPRDGRAARHSSGAVLVSLHGDFAVRLDLAQAITASAHVAGSSALMRRGADAGEGLPLGGAIRPLIVLEGGRQVVLRARPSRSLHVVDLDDQSLYLREDCLGAMDASLDYDNGRLASGHGDSISVVHVHGAGLVVLELPKHFVSMELFEATGCVLPCASILGWAGRIVARSLPAADAPGDGRGWAALSGEGSVLFEPSGGSER